MMDKNINKQNAIKARLQNINFMGDKRSHMSLLENRVTKNAVVYHHHIFIFWGLNTPIMQDCLVPSIQLLGLGKVTFFVSLKLKSLYTHI